MDTDGHEWGSRGGYIHVARDRGNSRATDFADFTDGEQPENESGNQEVREEQGEGAMFKIVKKELKSPFLVSKCQKLIPNSPQTVKKGEKTNKRHFFAWQGWG